MEIERILIFQIRKKIDEIHRIHHEEIELGEFNAHRIYLSCAKNAIRAQPPESTWVNGSQNTERER